jgi:hypothetical protein
MMMILVKIKIVLNRPYVVVNRSSIVQRWSPHVCAFRGGVRSGERGAESTNWHFVEVARNPAPTTVMITSQMLYYYSVN